MASITQTIPSYLGGVSKQPDVRKLEGQVSELNNAHPDPTFGMMKRPGFTYVQKIGDSPEFDNVKWFHAFRDKKESYFGCITQGTIKVWDAIEGGEALVVEGALDGTITDIGPFTSTYLAGNKSIDFDILTVQDTTYVTNKTIVVDTQPKPEYLANARATVRIKSVEYSATYTITIDDEDYEVKTRNGDNVEYDPDDPDKHTDVLNADEILQDMKEVIDAGDSGVTVLVLKGSLEIEHTEAFTIQAKGGVTNEGLEAYQDAVENVSKLAAETVHNRLVKIINTAQEKDSYFSQYIADDEISGVGYWQEARGPEASPGLVNETMPHQLLSLGFGRFVWNETDQKFDFETDEDESNQYCFLFKPTKFTERLVGDEESNSDPSFVGDTIQQTFFFSNRLGFLTSDNVSMSQAGEYHNFFYISALTQGDSDPVDISCSSIRPALLSGVVPIARGLLLFSRTQQFIMYSDDGNLSPNDSIISTISNYEYDIDIEPVSTGTRVNFVSKTKSGAIGAPVRNVQNEEGYTRVFGMIPQGPDQEPTVVDISSVVADWIPNTVDQMVSSPQNSFIALAGVNSREVFFFRTHSDGQKDILQAWYKWTLPGNVQSMVVQNDVLSVVSEAGGEYSIIKCVLNVVQDDTILVNDDGIIYGTPCVDMFAKNEGIIYEDGDSYITLPYSDIPELEPIAMLSLPPGTDPSDYPGLDSIELNTTRADGKFVVEGKDLTTIDNLIVIGYKYAMDVTLPTVYRSVDEKTKDFTASLTVSRMKFVVGLSDQITFKLNAQGSAEWNDLNPIIDSQPYIASTLPVDRQTIFHFPIHQRNNHFNVRVVSDSAFPVSLIAMAWEGNYSPKFYRRT